MTDAVDTRVKPPARGRIARFFQQEDLNFLLTNRVPRIALTRAMGRVSRIDSPLFTRAAIALWRLFTELDLSEARQTRFRSIHDCFTRELKPGARPIDRRAEVLASPCDAIVGALGRVERGQVFQAKGMPYATADLFGSDAAAAPFEGGSYVTLRLTSAMYHRFHAPHDLTVEGVTYFSGDTWNVNPIALARIERLFCRNERALVHVRLKDSGHALALVPVAAILVASLRLHCLPGVPYPRQRGARDTPCAAPHAKGQEMGWFEHGSTIIVFAPPGFALAEGIASGTRIRMGQALMRLPAAP
jgi:phosphatidylserine decarboxylase